MVIEAASSEILTRPIGVTGQGDFHNQLLRLRAPQAWSPRRWLEHTRAAEIAAGRRDTYHWGPRRADVDIILLGEDGDLEVEEPRLVVPHPEIGNRPFIAAAAEGAGSLKRRRSHRDSRRVSTQPDERARSQAVGDLSDAVHVLHQRQRSASE